MADHLPDTDILFTQFAAEAGSFAAARSRFQSLVTDLIDIRHPDANEVAGPGGTDWGIDTYVGSLAGDVFVWQSEFFLLVVLAVAVAVGVAVVGGVRSFEAVSARFGSVLVPLTADGMIVACTALRLAALTRGWRLPGSLLVTYGFIAGTVALNVAAAHGWADAVAHALAPVSYAVLVEMLAHLLRLHLRLSQPTRPRLTLLDLGHLAGRHDAGVAAPGQDRRRRPGGRPCADPAGDPHGLPAPHGLPRPMASRPGPGRPGGRAADHPRRPALRGDFGRPATRRRRPAAARRAARPRRPGRTAVHCTGRAAPHCSWCTGVHRRRCTGAHRARRTAAAPVR